MELGCCRKHQMLPTQGGGAPPFGGPPQQGQGFSGGGYQGKLKDRVSVALCRCALRHRKNGCLHSFLPQAHSLELLHPLLLHQMVSPSINNNNLHKVCQYTIPNKETSLLHLQWVSHLRIFNNNNNYRKVSLQWASNNSSHNNSGICLHRLLLDSVNRVSME